MRRLFLTFIAILSLSSCAKLEEREIAPDAGLLPSSLTLENTSEFIESVAAKGEGTLKLLVVPCRFEGEREFQEGDLSRIERAFFEDDLSTKGEGNYYSVKEFYKRSSLGKLDIEGEVTSVVEVPYTVEEVENDGNYFPGVPASEYLNSATDEKLREYDLDRDGYVDSVIFVYSSPTSSRNGHFWAWVHTFATDPNLIRPSLARHMWVGIDSFVDEYYSSTDAHAIIHETGHLLGLRDYYPSDNYDVALGGHSMMDYNISDHDPYSKMLLGWADPIYYGFDDYDEVTFDLPKFQGSNKVFLFNPSWNHSVMDEYLLFEYYTPDILNELDAKNQYSNRPLGFDVSGIKIYHVDSRVSKCHLDESASKLVFDSYVSEIPTKEDGSYYVIGASNNEGDSRTDASREGRYKQIALVENKEYNRLQIGESADNDSLFKTGDVFDSSSSAYLLRGSWNNGKKIGVTMEVKELNDECARICVRYQGE